MGVGRLDQIVCLAKAFRLDEPRIDTIRYLESNTFLPTIGAEIEIHWRTLIPQYELWFEQGNYHTFSEEKKASFDALCSQIEKDKKPLFQKTQNYGINKGHDGFYEFAFKPVHWYETATTEINILYQAGLINPHFDNPLHVTIAGLGNSVDTGILACVSELLGSTTYSRLMRACKSSITRQTWDKKGKSGIVKKRKVLLENASTDGTELRTLVAKTPEQVYDTVKNIQLLSWGITANIGSPEYNCWQDIKEYTLSQILQPRKLNRWWTKPQKSSADWHTFGLLLDDSTIVEQKQYLKDSIYVLDTLAKKKAKASIPLVGENAVFM